MSARIPAHIIDEIMNAARIEEVIGSYVQLKKAGANYKALSPFTEEKTPSFMVSPAKQIFKCFSTGKGGTVVTFLMELEQFSYPEALRWLAERYNIELPEEKPLTVEEQIELSERESLQIVNTYARDFFVETLHQSQEGKSIGLSYFKERGFDQETITQFQLGYCPNEEKSLTETALEKGYKQQYLETLGLTKTKNDRRFDFFKGRVIFPIHSVSGKVLGFGGRTLRSDKKVAKYFNSPESILYDKSKVLYGIYFAKNEIVKQDNCYLVEGYTDVISLFQAGIHNVVSSSGTSLTEGQIKLIKRYTPNITVLYDSDAAGIKASFRGIDMLLAAGMNIKVLLFPEGDDPDSFAKSHSKSEVKEYLEQNIQDFVSFKTDILLKEAQNDPLQKAQLIKQIIQSIALIPDNITRSVYTKQTAERFGFEEITLSGEINKIRVQSQQKEAPKLSPDNAVLETLLQPKKGTSSQDSNTQKRSFYPQEYDLARLLVLYGSRAIEMNTDNQQGGNHDQIVEVSVAELIIYELDRDDLQFDTPIFQEIYSICKDGIEKNTFYEPERFLRNENSKMVQFITDILATRYELSSHWLSTYKIETTEEIHQLGQAVKESLYLFKNATLLKRISVIQEALQSNKDDMDVVKNLLLEQIEIEKIRMAFAKQLNRIII